MTGKDVQYPDSLPGLIEGGAEAISAELPRIERIPAADGPPEFTWVLLTVLLFDKKFGGAGAWVVGTGVLVGFGGLGVGVGLGVFVGRGVFVGPAVFVGAWVLGGEVGSWVLGGDVGSWVLGGEVGSCVFGGEVGSWVSVGAVVGGTDIVAVAVCAFVGARVPVVVAVGISVRVGVGVPAGVCAPAAVRVTVESGARLVLVSPVNGAGEVRSGVREAVGVEARSKIRSGFTAGVPDTYGVPN